MLEFIKKQKIFVLTLLIILGLNLVIFKLSVNYVQDFADSKLTLATLDLKQNIDARVNQYNNAMGQAAAFFSIKGDVKKSEWEDYINTSKIFQNHPGIRALTYSPVIDAKDLDKFKSHLADYGIDDLKIFPDTPTAQYAPVIFLKPFDNSTKKAFGFNIFSDPSRKQTASYAIDNNTHSITNKLTLVADIGKPNPPPAVIIYYPVYKFGADITTVENRRQNVIGLISAGVELSQILGDVELNDAPGVKFQVFDNSQDGQLSTTNLLFNSGSEELIKPGNVTKFSSNNTIDWPNTVWHVRFVAVPDPAFNKVFELTPYIITTIGLLISILFLIFLKKGIGMYGTQLGQKQAFQSRLKVEDALVDSFSEGIIATNETGLITVYNQRMQDMLGYSEDSVVKRKNLVELLAIETLQAQVVRLEKELHTQAKHEFDALISIALVEGKDKQEWLVHSQSGQILKFSVTIKPLFEDRKVLVGYQFILAS